MDLLSVSPRCITNIKQWWIDIDGKTEGLGGKNLLACCRSDVIYQFACECSNEDFVLRGKSSLCSGRIIGGGLKLF